MKSKKNIKSIFVLAIISIFSLFFINKSFALDTAKISVETANLRSEANSNSAIIELISKGEEVQVLERNSEWYKVKYNNYTGYLRKDLLDDNVQSSEKTESTQSVEENSTNTVENNSVSENTTNNVVEATNNAEVQNTENENNVAENTTTTSITPEQNNENNLKGTYKVTQEDTLRITPLITSLEITKISKDVNVEVSTIINNWAWMTTSDGNQGWARIENLEKVENVPDENQEVQKVEEEVVNPEEDKKEEENKPAEQTATQTKYINVQSANLRETGDKAGKLITQLVINTQVSVLSEENGWAYVEVNGKKGYISASLLSTSKQETSRSSLNSRETTSTETQAQNTTPAPAQSSTASGNGSAVISYANQFLGCKYVYGGTSTAGFDCSGFTQYVYKNFGVNLNRTAAAQYSNGTAVTDLQAGDLVMFGKSGINHVGIYIGGGTFIHAANPSRGVTTDSLNSGYYKNNYVGARRVY